jgi:hypothetical protein
MSIPLKCLVAIAVSAYGCLQFVGLGLTGTETTPITEPLLLALGLSAAAGVTIALLPKIALPHVLTAAGLPVGYLVFLLLLGAIEDRQLPSLTSVLILFGMVMLITLPEAIKMFLKKDNREANSPDITQ